MKRERSLTSALALAPFQSDEPLPVRCCDHLVALLALMNPVGQVIEVPAALKHALSNPYWTGRGFPPPVDVNLCAHSTVAPGTTTLLLYAVQGPGGVLSQ